MTNPIDKISQFSKFGSILGLERMTSLLELLGNPEEDLKVIHVAGTNGKGSICRYIYSVLRQGGYKVGLYTSPFLEVFNERIEFDGEYISDEDLAVYTDRVLKCVDVMVGRGEQSPTEFEVITAIAFLYFKEKDCDYVVLEVGLGGRGDSTNVCKKPLVSVIASISFDHTDRLGNTLAQIAGEKAGIIKEGCPVVTSAESEEALAVIRKTAEEKGCEYFETKDLECTITEQSLSGYKFDVKQVEGLEISMLGKHQIKNAIAAVTAIVVMMKNRVVDLDPDAIYDGLKKAKQIGRFEVMQGGSDSKEPLVIIDGAHNPDGAKVLRETMETFCSGKKILMVTGMLADKDVDSILKEFRAITGDFIATEPVNPRKLDASALKDKIESLGGSCIEAADYRKACELAKEKYPDYDVVLFAGSLYLIGLIRGLLK